MTAESVIHLATPDGALPVKVFHRPHFFGNVIIYMDAFGWRHELDEICRMYCEAGFRTFLPDLFWRQGRLRFRPTRSAEEPLDSAMVNANLATTMDMTIADTAAILSEATGSCPSQCHRFGAVGYCMGARHALAAAAQYPKLIRYAACLHGGRMVSRDAFSPHLLIPKVSGRLYLAFAEHDDTCPQDHQETLRDTIAVSQIRGETEVFSAEHGWTFPDRWCHHPTAAAAVHGKVLAHLQEEVAEAGTPAR